MISPPSLRHYKLLDEVRRKMRLHHYSIHTERSYVDWIKRYIHFHHMRSRDDLANGETKLEAFCTDLAVNGKVSASTQNQACRSYWGTRTNGVAPTLSADGRNPVGVGSQNATRSQGSSFLATLGFVAESLWDSRKSFLKMWIMTRCHQIVQGTGDTPATLL